MPDGNFETTGRLGVGENPKLAGRGIFGPEEWFAWPALHCQNFGAAKGGYPGKCRRGYESDCWAIVRETSPTLGL